MSRERDAAEREELPLGELAGLVEEEKVHLSYRYAEPGAASTRVRRDRGVRLKSDTGRAAMRRHEPPEIDQAGRFLAASSAVIRSM